MSRAPIAPSTTNTIRVGLLADPAAPTKIARRISNLESRGGEGRDAWIIESDLGFDIPGLQAKHELLIVVIVDTGDGAAGLFYASVPENAPQLVAAARLSLAALSVD